MNNFNKACKIYGVPDSIKKWVYEQSAGLAIDLNTVNTSNKPPLKAIYVGEQRTGKFIIIVVEPAISASLYQRVGFRHEMTKLYYRPDGQTIFKEQQQA